MKRTAKDVDVAVETLRAIIEQLGGMEETLYALSDAARRIARDCETNNAMTHWRAAAAIIEVLPSEHGAIRAAIHA